MKPPSLKAATYITLAAMIGAGGIAWGTLKAQTEKTEEVSEENSLQIKLLSQEIEDLSIGQAVIGTRTRRIETEQIIIRNDVKELLRRIPRAPRDQE